MEVILLQDVEKLGESGDVVTVKNGYGRNYLIPQKLAVIANKTNRHVVEEKLAKKEAELARRLDEFKAIGCDTARDVLQLNREELIRRTDLEEETIQEVLDIIRQEFE